MDPRTSVIIQAKSRATHTKTTTKTQKTPFFLELEIAWLRKTPKICELSKNNSETLLHSIRLHSTHQKEYYRLDNCIMVVGRQSANENIFFMYFSHHFQLFLLIILFKHKKKR